jgi:hypothetical protein
MTVNMKVVNLKFKFWNIRWLFLKHATSHILITMNTLDLHTNNNNNNNNFTYINIHR